MRWWSPRDPVEPTYMPGRSRTGSRPSRTVMSFAVYVVSVIKKALLLRRFWALGSLPERPVVRLPRTRRQAGRGRPRDELSQLRVLDPRCDLAAGLPRRLAD